MDTYETIASCRATLARWAERQSELDRKTAELGERSRAAIARSRALLEQTRKISVDMPLRRQPDL